jgi:hypothetical protein
MAFNSKTVYNSILFLIFLIGLFLLIRYVRSVEGFANPSIELYDLHEFFKQYPIGEICPIYNGVFQQVILTQKLDDAGKPYPNDIALEKAMKITTTDIIAGVLPCPFQLPETANLDASLEFARNLDPDILSKAMNTILYCAVNTKQAVNNANDAILKKPPRATEGFITECSNFELEAASVVPLQCIPAAKMKATELEEIKSEDKTVQQVKQGKKIEITKKLFLITTRYIKFMTDFRTIINKQVEDLSPKFLKLEAGVELIKKRLEKDLGDDERSEVQKRMESLVGEKTATENLLKKMILFQSYQYKSMAELITITKTNQEEFKKIEGKMKSGEISF